MYFYQLKEQGRDFWARPGKPRGVCYLNKVTEKTEIQECPQSSSVENLGGERVEKKGGEEGKGKVAGDTGEIREALEY